MAVYLDFGVGKLSIKMGQCGFTFTPKFLAKVRKVDEIVSSGGDVPWPRRRPKAADAPRGFTGRRADFPDLCMLVLANNGPNRALSSLPANS